MNIKRLIFAIACNADMAELADAPALGAGVFDVGVQIPLSAPKEESPSGLFSFGVMLS